MNVLKYRVSLDMFDALSQVTIKAKKGDSACEIHITLTEKGKVYKIGEGCRAFFNAKKSDGNFISGNCTIKDNTIVYNFAESIDEDGVCQISACEGIVECEVTLYKETGKQLTSPHFTLFIDGTVYNGEEIASSTQSDALRELINEAEKTIEEVETKLKNVINTKLSNFVGMTRTNVLNDLYNPYITLLDGSEYCAEYGDVILYTSSGYECDANGDGYTDDYDYDIVTEMLAGGIIRDDKYDVDGDGVLTVQDRSYIRFALNDNKYFRWNNYEWEPYYLVADKVYNPNSLNPQSGKAVKEALSGVSVDLSNYYTKDEIDNKIGDIESAFDTLIADQEAIIAIQNALIGGGGE